MSESHSIGFIAHTDALQFVSARIFKSMANDALNPFAGVDVFLDGNFVSGILFEKPTYTNVKTFRVLSKHDEAHIFGGAIAQWRETIME